MKITVLTGSPHKAGSSNLLAHEFITGAEKAGHSVTVLDAAHMRLNHCMGCDECKKAGKCFHRDDGAAAQNEILSSDMVVFVTPVYYFGMSAQLKTLVDRFHGYTAALKERGMKAALIASLADQDESAVLPLKVHYEKICSYLRFQSEGVIFAKGCATPALTRASRYMREAYHLGLKLK